MRLFVSAAGTGRVEIAPDDAERLRRLYRHAAVLSPNHPTPAEGPLMYLVSHRLGLRYAHCAAREIYDKFGPLGPRMFAGMGCFSIRRRMVDQPAVHAARALLAARRNVVLFPEGEISGLSDRLLPLERGGVRIAFWGLEALRAASGGGAATEHLYLVPIAIKYRETGDAARAVLDSLGRLERTLDLVPAEGRGALWRWERIESAYLASLETELGRAAGGCREGGGAGAGTNARWDRVRRALEARAAAGLGVEPPRPDLTNPQRARELLNAWDAAWLAHGPNGPLRNGQARSDLKAIHKDLARLNRFMGFDEDYVPSWPSLERFGDVLRRVEDQVLGRHGFKGRRVARLRVGEPIDVAAYHEDYVRDRRAAVARVTEELDGRMNSVLAGLVAELSAPWEGAWDGGDGAATARGIFPDPATGRFRGPAPSGRRSVG